MMLRFVLSREHCSTTGFAMRNVGESGAAKSNRLPFDLLFGSSDEQRCCRQNALHWEASININSPSQKMAELKTLRVAAPG